MIVTLRFEFNSHFNVNAIPEHNVENVGLEYKFPEYISTLHRNSKRNINLAYWFCNCHPVVQLKRKHFVLNYKQVTCTLGCTSTLDDMLSYQNYCRENVMFLINLLKLILFTLL